jgi:hypothetical protein
MNGKLINRTLMIRVGLLMAMVGGAIVASTHLESATTITATQTASRQHLSVQLNAW